MQLDYESIREELADLSYSGSFANGIPDDVLREVRGVPLGDLVEFVLPKARQRMPRDLRDADMMDVLGRYWEASLELGVVKYANQLDYDTGEGRDSLSFPVRFEGGSGALSEVKLGRNARSGKPWVIFYVGDLDAGRQVHPSQALERFAWLGRWDGFLRDLADVALPEAWDFGGPSSSRPYEILKSYIVTTFYRLQQEGKVRIDERNGFAAFNTGLVDGHYNDIYATFVPNNRPEIVPWYFNGFASKKRRDLKKQVNSLFNPLPARAKYTGGSIAELLFDPDLELQVDYEHILTDNIARLPLEFLQNVAEARGNDEAVELVCAMREAGDLEQRNRFAQELGDVLDDDDRLFRSMESDVKNAIELAKRRVRWNFKTAIPMYHPRANKMCHLLPLCLVREDRADAALVVDLVPSGIYQGQTILTMQMAYKNARLICRPDSDWLTPRAYDLYDGDDDWDD